MHMFRLPQQGSVARGPMPRRAERDSSRWNDAEIYTAIARTLNLTSDQRRTVLAARRYLQDKLAKCAASDVK